MRAPVLFVLFPLMMACSNPGAQEDKRLVEKYRKMTVIDTHNHDAAWFNAFGLFQLRSFLLWEQYGIDGIVLFGYFSEPRAMQSDDTAFKVYRKHPRRFYPFFAGVNVHDESGPAYVRERLEQGFFGMGEIAAASIYSPFAAKLPWKGQHPMDGYLPEIYRICGEYKAPVLLHIDPPFGPPFPVRELEKALMAYPDTVFIFAHANAYNSPDNLEPLLEKYDNLYIDFYAGFTAFNPESSQTLEEYVPLIERFSDRFLLSSDSGAEITYRQSCIAIYRLLDLLEPETAERVSHGNFIRLMEVQEMTGRQRDRIEAISRREKIPVDSSGFNKREAGEWLALQGG